MPDDSDARFQAIVQAAAIGIALVDLSGHPIETNPSLQRFLGYTADELRAMTFAEVTHPDDVDRDVALARELFAGTRDAYQVEKRYVRRDGAVVWGRLTASLMRDRTGQPAYAIGMVEDITDRVRLQQRREGLLRIARRLASEGEPAAIMQYLLQEAATLTGAAFGMVARWDEARGLLVPVWHTLPLPTAPVPIALGVGAGGQAAARREPVIVDDYRHYSHRVRGVAKAGIRAAVAAPLLHEGRLLGVVLAATDQVNKHFQAVDAELLELLASMASAVLVGLDRSRLEGVLLAARTAQHNLRNQLAALVGYCDLVREDPRVPGDLREWLAEATQGAEQAITTLARLQGLTRLEEVDPGGVGGTLIDLSHST